MSWNTWTSSEEAFQPQNIPSRREEEWKYVSLRWLDNWNFKPALKEDIQILPLSDQFEEIIFVNGYLFSDLPKGFYCEVLARDEAPSEAFQSWFAAFEARKLQIQAPTDVFEDLNRSRFQEGLFLDVAPGTVPSKPVLLRWIVTSSLGTRYPRAWINIGDRAKLVLAESYESSSLTDALSVPVTEVEVGHSAKFEFARVSRGSLQNSQIGRTRILQKGDSSVESLSVAMGAKLVRHNLDVFLCEDGAFSRLHGLSFTGGEQVVDHHTRIDHVVGGCQTTQFYKYVLNGTSRAVFNGQVVIRHGSQKANSEQLNQNLLLSRTAEVDTKPQLEISADDVKAAHGATIGHLDEEEIFYLLSRGIAREQAIAMIRRGFTQDLLQQVSDPVVRSWLLSLQDEADQRLSS